MLFLTAVGIVVPTGNDMERRRHNRWRDFDVPVLDVQVFTVLIALPRVSFEFDSISLTTTSCVVTAFRKIVNAFILIGAFP